LIEAKYEIHEMDDGRYEVLEPGSDAPVTIKATCEEATAWVRKMEGDTAVHHNE
jgi:hypothetical protein